MEKITLPTEDDIFTGFETLIDGEFSPVRKLEDEQGIYLWEVSVPVEGRGAILYQYMREGRHSEGDSVDMTMNKVFYDVYGRPFHGFSLAKFQSDAWVLEAGEGLDFVHPDVIEDSEFEQYEGARRESGPEVLEYLDLCIRTAEQYNIDTLYQIEDGIEAKANVSRDEVKLVCAKLIKMMRTLEAESTITEDELKTLQAQYKYLSRATGSINSGKVDHTR